MDCLRIFSLCFLLVVVSAVATTAAAAADDPPDFLDDRGDGGSGTTHRALRYCPPNNVRYFFSGDVHVRKYGGNLNPQTCSSHEKKQIARIIEDIMEDQLGAMGFKEREVKVCSRNRRRRLELQHHNASAIAISTPTLRGENTTTLEQRGLREYGGGFYFEHGGRCGQWCPTDNFDKRRSLLRHNEDSKTLFAHGSLDGSHSANAKKPSKSRHGHRHLAGCREKEYRVEYIDFDRDGQFNQWTFSSRRSQSNGFGRFFGPFYDGNTPYRRFENIPGDADQIAVQFTFNEVDNWRSSKGDHLVVRINGHRINVGTFDSRRDEGTRSGYVHEAQMSWSMASLKPPAHLGFDSALDQRHRFVATFPRSLNHVGLKIIPRLSSKDAFAGIDDVRIVAVRTCRATTSFDGFMEVAERRMEAELQLELYHRFYRKGSHCMNKVLARVDMDLEEEPSWEAAQPNC